MPDGQYSVVSAKSASCFSIASALFSTSCITKAKRYTSQPHQGLFQSTTDNYFQNLYFPIKACFSFEAQTTNGQEVSVRYTSMSF